MRRHKCIETKALPAVRREGPFCVSAGEGGVFAKITKKYLEKLEEKSKMYPTQVVGIVL